MHRRRMPDRPMHRAPRVLAVLGALGLCVALGTCAGTPELAAGGGWWRWVSAPFWPVRTHWRDPVHLADWPLGLPWTGATPGSRRPEMLPGGYPPGAPPASDDTARGDRTPPHEGAQGTAPGDTRPGDPAPAAPAVALAQTERVAITGLRLARIGLEAGVVPAPLVEVPGGRTWAVPAFRAGHGENTAGAGQPGNAVLVGHLTSVDAGSVFRDLRLARPGDQVEISGPAGSFLYMVTSVRSVPRTDLSPLQPTETPSLTLITCSGVWSPALQDFTERLAVRAELAGPTPS